MEYKYICENCKKTFDDEYVCLEHERKCNAVITLVCDKCGKIKSYKKENCFNYLDNYWHHINLGRVGYGSKLDGCDVNFMICDDCLTQFINTFFNKDKIYNSGSNFNYFDDF